MAAATWLVTAAANAQVPTDELRMHVIRETATFKKTDIVSAEVVIESGHTVISIALSPDGAKRFATLTEKHVGMPVQIVVGDRILTTPLVKEPIASGRLHISGNFSKEEAEAIVARLR
ncbi:MAG: hypothetical protein AB7E67_14135 [Xanthobacteraceae bacterium]